MREFHNLIEMLRDLEFVVEHTAHDAERIDHERHPLRDAEERPQNAVALRDQFVGVADHRKLHLMLLGEAAAARDRIGGDTDHLDAHRMELRIVVAETLRLDGARRRERAREKIENDDVTALGAESEFSPGGRFRVDVGREIAGFQHERQA